MFPARKYREFRHSGLEPRLTGLRPNQPTTGCFAICWISASADMTFMLFVLFARPDQ